MQFLTSFVVRYHLQILLFTLCCIIWDWSLYNMLSVFLYHLLRYLLPDMRDSIITNQLRSANKFPLIFAKTNKFKNSFICYGLSHYQLTAWHSHIYLQCLLYCTVPASGCHTPINSFVLYLWNTHRNNCYCFRWWSMC